MATIDVIRAAVNALIPSGHMKYIPAVNVRSAIVDSASTSILADVATQQAQIATLQGIVGGTPPTDPLLALNVDDGSARMRLSSGTGNPTISVGPTGGGSNVPAIQMSPAGLVSFPNGVSIGTGFRNKIRNGRFSVIQRGSPQTLPGGNSNAYIFDSWRSYNGTTTTCTISQVAPAPSGFSVKGTALKQATTSTGIVHFFQTLEPDDVADLNGVASVLSFDMAAPAGTAGAHVIVYNWVGYNDHSSYITVTDTNYTAPGPTGGRVSISVPSSNSFGNGARIRISLTVPAGGGDVYISNVVWEKGTQPTINPEFLPYDYELLRAQRFYQNSYQRGVLPASLNADTGYRRQLEASTSICLFSVFYPVKMYPYYLGAPLVQLFSPVTGVGDRFYNYTTAADMQARKNDTSQMGFEAVLDGPTAALFDKIGMAWTAVADLNDNNAVP